MIKTSMATVTDTGQITLPPEVRQHLGINANDKVGFIMEDDGSVRLALEHDRTIASLAGAAGSLETPRSWNEVQTIARDDHLTAKYGKR